MEKQDRVPRYDELINPTLKALQSLGGSGKNDEIYDEVVKQLSLPDSVVDMVYSNGENKLGYNLSWARTYMKKYGAIENSARAVWALTPEFMSTQKLDEKKVAQVALRLMGEAKKKLPKAAAEMQPNEIFYEQPSELILWRKRLHSILTTMDAYAFERLAKRLLREMGCDAVEVTKKSGDGGIDGTGKFKLQGIFSFNIAFQCKRYKETTPVGAPEIRDFRGSLTTDIEKGLFITTSTFSKAAKEEAAKPGKQQIDLMNGEELMDKLAELGIGLSEEKTYVIDENYFAKI